MKLIKTESIVEIAELYDFDVSSFDVITIISKDSGFAKFYWDSSLTTKEFFVRLQKFFEEHNYNRGKSQMVLELLSEQMGNQNG